MDKNRTMATNDAPVAKFAEVFVTLGTQRHAMLMCKDFEGKVNISTHGQRDHGEETHDCRTFVYNDDIQMHRNF